MSRKYKFLNKEGLYFVSFATVNWVDVFIRPNYCDLVVESLIHCYQKLGLELYCWCIMSSHLHLIYESTRDTRALAWFNRTGLVQLNIDI